MYFFKKLLQRMHTSVKKHTEQSIHIIGLAEDWQLSSTDTLDVIRMQIDELTI